jgi:hypothetical protein
LEYRSRTPLTTVFETGGRRFSFGEDADPFVVVGVVAGVYLKSAARGSAV